MIQSVQRAAQILSLFKQNEFLSLAEIAELTKLPKTTAHGLVSTLRQENLLEQDPVTKAYCPGIGLFELSSLYRGRLNLRSIAMPYLGTLADETKHTVQLAVLNGRNIVYLYKITTPNFMTFAISEGVRAPAHCTSTGKAVLAYMPKKEVAALYSGVALEPCTPYSLSDYAQLLAHLERTRANGFSTDLQEINLGLGGVSVPLFDHHGVVCGTICISFPVEHYESILAKELALLKASAVQISLRLGCPHSLLPPEILS